MRPDGHRGDASHVARLERVLAEYGGALRRLACAYSSGSAGVDDLLQEIAIALWDALPLFRGDCSERTFVFRVARNRAITHRHRNRPSGISLDAAHDVEDPVPRADEAAEQRALREELMQHVQRLPETLRAVVVLRLEGLSDAEAGDVLGISAGNVAVRLTRARTALRAAMTQQVGDRT